MSELTLYFSPGACSRVTLIAIEETGVEYTCRLVALQKGEQQASEFLAINPKGKVPALVVDNCVLTENVAILSYLATRHPQAGLLPDQTSWVRAEALSMLVWFASGMHPLVTRMRRPQRFCDTADSTERVQELARLEMLEQLAIVEHRLSAQPWMLGKVWSVVDAYLFWVWGRCPESGIEPGRFPNLCNHLERSVDRPAVQRALQREVKPG